MHGSLLIDQGPELGHWARNLRSSLGLTQQQLARLAKVTAEEINLFEQDNLLSVDIKIKILKELSVRKVYNWDRRSNC